MERRTRGRPRARKLLRLLEGKRNILVTTHVHPDPDALASSMALATLLRNRLKDAHVGLSIKGRIGGGINDVFTKLSKLDLVSWDDATLNQYDAIILLDTQPQFAANPLPAGVEPIAVIDHHRAPGKKLSCAFCDIRTDVGATSSIIFSYFMELETPIPRDLAASLLYAIESDLAGAAGTPGELDNIALSSLTLIADTRKLYQMRYVDLPQSYYTAYFDGLANAVYHDNAMVSHLDTIDSPEQPAVNADFLLRFDKVQWALVTAVYGEKLVMSLRTSNTKNLNAADVMRRLLRNLGEGGGHRTKAGGFILLETNSPSEIDRKRNILRKRFLRALGIKQARGQKLVSKPVA
ncbi:MAG: DHH family phosphoesterase [Tepidisphaeraceae bacterium]